MYTEWIEKLNPKPKFNLTWYKNEDLYSDGDIEDLIIKLIAENEPENFSRAIRENLCWATYYHLTHLRKNLLNWYPFKKESSLLEIGCGMGAATNMFCEKCESVTAVELSKRRAAGALLRCRERENLEIIVGNLNDIQFDKKFDYITLIGVLEYQGTYTNSSNSYLDFLVEIRKLLKPGGKLLIAIENKYGLKYWCGAKEDHTGIPFEGMNQYAISNRKVKTFARKELEDLVKESGFENAFFYYPMPDYKLPTVVYSQSSLPTDENMQSLRPYYIPDTDTVIANEKQIYKDVIENNAFEFFANSFLVECSDDEEVGRILFSRLSSERKDKYQIATVFTNENMVEKFALIPEKGETHIAQILKNHNALERAGKKTLAMELNKGRLISPYISAPLLQDIALDTCRRKDMAGFFQIIDKVWEEILSSSNHIKAEDNIFFTTGIDEDRDTEKYGPILRIGYLDMVLSNAFYDNGELLWFDQEWILESVPAKFVLYRGIVEFYNAYPWMESFISVEMMAARYGMLSVWEQFQILAGTFLDMLSDEYHWGIRQMNIPIDRDTCARNIQKLLE